MAKEEKQTDASSDEHGADAAVGGKKKLIIIIAAAVLLLGGGAAAYFMMGNKKADTEHAAEAPASGEHGEGSAAATGPVQPVFYELPEFLVNLNSSGKTVSFLKMKVAIELEKPDDIKAVEVYLPRITDTFNGYLRELRASDLSGSAGMVRLKEELLLRLNKSLDGVHVRNVYIKQILVQ